MAESEYRKKLRDLRKEYLKAQALVTKNIPVYDIAVKILAEWTPNKFYSFGPYRCGYIWWLNDRVDLHMYLAKVDSMAKDANLFLEEIEERFGLPEPRTSIYSQDKHFNYGFLQLIIHTEKSEACRYVKTGRMVEETKLVCD